MTLAAVLVLGSGPAHAAGDPAKGQQVYQSQCAACHSTSPGVTLFGPSLADVYGKPAASMKGYSYSPALAGAKLVWTADALDKFLTAPMTDVPGTKMPFAGLPDPTQRADVIAYLAQLAKAHRSGQWTGARGRRSRQRPAGLSEPMRRVPLNQPRRHTVRAEPRGCLRQARGKHEGLFLFTGAGRSEACLGQRMRSTNSLLRR